MKDLTLPRVRIRLSPLTYVIFGLMVVELILTILALSLPWGKAASGADVRFGLGGLLPWFGFVPVLLQVGYLAVEAGVLRGLYLVTNFMIGLFIIFVHYLTYIRNTANFQWGFYLVFVLGGVILVTGIMCLVERAVYAGAEEKAPAGDIPVSFG